jgi:DNA polymerase
MTTLYLDYETRAVADLTLTGPYVYVVDPTFRVLVINYAVDTGPVITVYGDEPAKYRVFLEALANAGRIVAHNVQFEWLVTSKLLRRQVPAIGAWDCTSSRARRHGLPAALGDAADALGLEHRKDKRGAQLIRLLCRPRKDGTFCNDAGLIAELGAYGARDVEVLRELDLALPTLDPNERLLFEYDFYLNLSGVHIDIELLWRLREVTLITSAQVDAALRELTAHKVTSVHQRDRILSWLADYVVVSDDLSRATVRDLLRRDELPEPAQRLLALRAEGSRTSTRKLEAFSARSIDDRLFGSLLYYGAATGRHSSVGVQLQNLPRPERKWWMLQEAISDLQLGIDLDQLRMLYGPPLDLVADLLRCLIVPQEGHVFEIADLNAIELRIAAWLAGEDGLLEEIVAGNDVYCRMAGVVFNRTVKPTEERERFLGKTLQLAGQYGMGWNRFTKTCETQGYPVDEVLARRAVDAYRDKHPAIVAMWRDLETAARQTIAGTRSGPFECWHDWLLMHLPSKRALYYYRPRIATDGSGRKSVVYQGVNSVTHQFGEQKVWGGLLFENAVQALARDVLMHGCLLLTASGHQVRLIVHDEVVCEVPVEEADIHAVEALMTTTPSWAPGLPLQAKGIVSERYRKI